MKEYLFKGIDGTYKVVDHDCQGRAIEIPDGAECLTECLENGELFRLWWKGEYKICIGCNDDWVNIKRDVDYYLKDQLGSEIVWKRHTQPEELPFVDDGDDQVNHPTHYTSGSIECIDAIESSMTKESFSGFLKGNVQKYMWRYENKGGVESLQKAQWYLSKLILLQSA